MKRKSSRLTPRELGLLFAPFPILWLCLGLFVNPAVFRFWQGGQRINPLDAMLLGFMPIIFALVYAFLLCVVRAIARPINFVSVAICALLAAFVGLVLSPIP